MATRAQRQTKVDNLAIARAVRKARADERSKIQAAQPVKQHRESVVLYKNGGDEFTLVTPLRFTNAQDAVDFAALLGGMFTAYQFMVAPASH